MQGVRGNIFFAIFATTIAIVAVIGFTTLRKAQHLRFAISIHTVPESPYHDLVPLGQPILLRIDKASAGRSPLKAFGYLLDGNGAKLTDAKPLLRKTLPSGRLTEEAEFPALTALPGQRLLAATVVRLPQDTPEARLQLESAMQAGLRKKASLPSAFSNLLAAAKQLGGHAELTQVEVRTKL